MVRAHIDKDYKRLIRIESKHGLPTGRDVNVYDAETGEMLTNIVSMAIRIDVLNVTEADITYFTFDESGNINTNEHGDPVGETITVSGVQMKNIAALETNQEVN